MIGSILAALLLGVPPVLTAIREDGRVTGLDLLSAATVALAGWALGWIGVLAGVGFLFANWAEFDVVAWFEKRVIWDSRTPPALD